MTCSITGFDKSGRLTIVTFSATSSEVQWCSIAKSDTDIRHVVKIQPQRKYYRHLKISGKLCHARGSVSAGFIGSSTINKSLWSVCVPLANVTITLKDIRFEHLLTGTEDVEVEIEAEDPWKPGCFEKADQKDLTFPISLL